MRFHAKLPRPRRRPARRRASRRAERLVGTKGPPYGQPLPSVKSSWRPSRRASRDAWRRQPRDNSSREVAEVPDAVGRVVHRHRIDGLDLGAPEAGVPHERQLARDLLRGDRPPNHHQRVIGRASGGGRGRGGGAGRGRRRPSPRERARARPRGRARSPGRKPPSRRRTGSVVGKPPDHLRAQGYGGRVRAAIGYAWPREGP